MTKVRLPLTKLAPKACQAMAGVCAPHWRHQPLGMPLIELVQTRASQINGCAYCLGTYARNLRKYGDTWQPINSLSTWREVGFYSERERAALVWAEVLILLSGKNGDYATAFGTLKTQFSEQEIVELTRAVADINAWNRMAVVMRQPPSDNALE